MNVQRKLVALTVSLLLLTVASSALAGTWNIDTGHSSVGFKVRHIFSNVSGTFDAWEGTIDFDPAHPEKGSVQVSIDVASINTKDEGRDGHLKSADFFDVENHAKMTFTSSKVTKSDDGFVMEGDLTIRGVTKAVSIPFQFMGSGAHPMMDGQVAGFNGSFKINRKDFGVSWNRVLDAGGTILGEEVTIDLEIEAVKANS